MTNVPGIKKITVGTICGKLKMEDKPKEVGAKVELMKVYGQARRFLPDSTDLGPYIKFKGSFKAINVKTGETKRSVNLILPDVAADLIEEGLSIDGATGVDFALMVGVEGDETNIGYHYYVESLVEMEESDPLALLESKMRDAGTLPALEAPKEDTQEADSPAKGNGKGRGRSRAKTAQASA